MHVSRTVATTVVTVATGGAGAVQGSAGEAQVERRGLTIGWAEGRVDPWLMGAGAQVDDKKDE